MIARVFFVLYCGLGKFVPNGLGKFLKKFFAGRTWDTL